MTQYVVLEEREGTWMDAGKVDARSARAAVTEIVAGETKGGTFVAIPARSWQPVKVQVETALKFS